MFVIIKLQNELDTLYYNKNKFIYLNSVLIFTGTGV